MKILKKSRKYGEWSYSRKVSLDRWKNTWEVNRHFFFSCEQDVEGKV